MKHVLLIIGVLMSTSVFAGKIQKQGIKTASDCTAAGAALSNCLPEDSQIWMTSVTPPQQLSTAVTAGLIGGGGGNSGKNYLSNASFEGGNSGWTITGATNAVNTSDFHDGAQSLTLTPTGAGSILQSVTPATNLKGSNLESGLWVKTTKTDVENCSYINAIEIECQKVAATGEWVYVPANAAGPAQGTSIGVKLKWGSTGGSILVDMGYTGGATNLTTIAQAKHVGTLKYAATTNCQYSVNPSGAWTSFPADTDCPTQVVTGGLTAPATKIPAFKMSITAGSIYRVTIKGGFENGLGTIENVYRLNDGTDSTEQCGRLAGISGLDVGRTSILSCLYKPTTSGEKTIEIQVNGSATASDIIVNGYADLVFEVEQFPSQSQLAVNSLQSDFGLTSFTPSFSCIGSPTGANFKYAKRGEKMFIIGRFTHSGGTGTCSFTLPNSLTANVSESGGTYNVVGYGTITSNNVALYALAQSGSGAISFGLSGPTSSGITPYSVTWSPEEVNFSMEVPIVGWHESQRAPTLVGSVTSGASDALRIEAADVAATTGAVTEVSGDWLNGNCTISGGTWGQYRNCNFNSGMWSSAPTCLVNATAGGGGYSPTIISTSSSAVVFALHVSGTGDVDVPANIMCIGPKQRCL